MRKTYSTIFVMLFGYLGYTQGRPPQDIRSQKIQATYEIVNGQTTGKSFIVKQSILDSLGRCHTEIDFDTTRTIQGFRWSTFSGNNLVVRQTYVEDVLVKVDSFTFESGGSVKQHFLTLKMPVGIENIIETYTYATHNQISKVEAKLKNGKTAYIVSFIYDSKGTELARKVKVKKSFPADSIVILKRIPTYDSLGRIITETVDRTFINKSITTDRIFYTYDKAGKTIGKTFLDLNGNPITRIEFIYNDNNTTLWQEKTYNSSNTLIKMLVWRTETIFKGPRGRFTSPGM